jgi:hypothetical protein
VTGEIDDTLACLRGAVIGGAEKKKEDRVLHENVLDVQDPCFFGAALRLPALACRFDRSEFLIGSCFPAALPLRPRCFWSFASPILECRMPERVFRVRAARAT